MNRILLAGPSNEEFPRILGVSSTCTTEIKPDESGFWLETSHTLRMAAVSEIGRLIDGYIDDLNAKGATEQQGAGNRSVVDPIDWVLAHYEPCDSVSSLYELAVEIDDMEVEEWG